MNMDSGWGQIRSECPLLMDKGRSIKSALPLSMIDKYQCIVTELVQTACSTSTSTSSGVIKKEKEKESEKAT